MSRYYFDVRDGDEFIADDEGWELSSIEVACREAVRTLAEMAREAVRLEHKDSSDYRMSIEIRDDSGLLLGVKLMFEVTRRRSDA